MKFVDDKKKSHSYDKFFVSNRNLLQNMLKMLKVQVFSRFFIQNSRLFKFFFSKILKIKVFPSLNCQILCFPGFLEKWQPCKQHICQAIK